jgi:Ca-activated chloride channel homolog
VRPAPAHSIPAEPPRPARHRLPARPGRLPIRPVAAALVLAAAVGLLAGACTSSPKPTGDGSAPLPPGTLRVLAGSELKDVEPLLGDLRAATGVSLKLDYTGTLDGAEQLTNGQHYDLAWFSSANYLTLLAGNGGPGRPVASKRIMLSPVVLGVKRSVATRLGWTGSRTVTWSDIAAAAKAGKLRYGMTNPAASNSGFAALVGVASAFAGTGQALRTSDINAAKLTEFFSGQALTAGSSGWLADAYTQAQDRLDGLVNYESVLLSLNASGRLHEPLTLVYPADGIVTADYPLLLMDPAKRAAYDKVVGWLRSPDVQRRLMTSTWRRPAEPSVPLDQHFSRQVLVEVPFPASRAVVDGLLFAYLDRLSKPAHTIYVLDTSGSMAGDRIAGLQSAFANLSGADKSVSGRFARFRQRERVTVIPFGSEVKDQRDVTVDTTKPTALTAVRDYVTGLQPGGTTAIYSALERAYQVVADDQAADRGYYVSIVLMTDGENNAGASVEEFLAWRNSLPEDARAVRTFAIRFGEADPGQLRQITDATGGQLFDATGGSLQSAFKEIRGYQ